MISHYHAANEKCLPHLFNHISKYLYSCIFIHNYVNINPCLSCLGRPVTTYLFPCIQQLSRIMKIIQLFKICF